MPVVQVPKEFFRKERRQLYSNWPGAFWRELTQNAADAGSYNITIQIRQHRGFVRVQFGDDGPGMDRDVLETIYFKLGETSKGGEYDITTLGGFGRARILTCFSMRRYTIRTRNLLVEGSGADYTLTEVAEEVTGCHLTIDIDDATMTEMREALRVFLRQSQLGCNVTVDGAKWTEWAARGVLATKLVHDGKPFAAVYVHPEGLANHVIVRARGIQSYFQMSRVPAQVIIEIEPQMLRSVLTGNRDGLLLAYRKVVDEFLEEMTLNTSILTEQRSYEPVRRTEEIFISVRLQDDEFELPDEVFVFDETDHQLPDNEIAPYCSEAWNDASPKYRMMIAWKIACEMTVHQMLRITRTKQLRWSVGWYFGAKQAVTKKAVLPDNESVSVFCINPLRGKDFWYSNKRHSWRRLLAIAQHEVTHAQHLNHDENFANLLTELNIAMDPVSVFKTIDEAIVTGRKPSRFHWKMLKLMEAHAERYGGRMNRSQVYDNWDIEDRPADGKLSARLSELERKFDEPLIEVAGTAMGEAGRNERNQKTYRLTSAGKRLLVEEPKLPPMTEEMQAAFQRIVDALYRKLEKRQEEAFQAIFRAGPQGITVAELATTDWAHERCIDAHMLSSRPTGLENLKLIELRGERSGKQLLVATYWLTEGADVAAPPLVSV